MADPFIIAAGVAFGWAGIVAVWTVRKHRKQRKQREQDGLAALRFGRVHRDPPGSRPATAYRSRIKPTPASSYDYPAGISPGLGLATDPTPSVDWANSNADSPSYSGGGGEFGGGGASGGWDSGGSSDSGSSGGDSGGGGGSSD